MSKELKNYEFIPEIILSVYKKYSIQTFWSDMRAGLLISVVAFPLFMTFAIASGVSPSIGITTCIVAGSLACLFGGARYQIVGPTGAFAMIVAGIIHNYGFEGMTCALIMAAIMMIAFGVTKIGDLIHYVPYPITAGFTAGIGLSIIVSQLGNFLGLHAASIPADFIGRIVYCSSNWSLINPYSFVLALVSLIFLEIMQAYHPKIPRYFCVLIFGILFSLIFKDVGMETIGSRFGDISNQLPTFSIPSEMFSVDTLKKLFPAAFSIAFLGSMESLLGAVISDNLSGQKHNSNMELIGQGIANLGSAFCGGIPATCALGTTTLNVKVGAKTPIAGLFNVFFLLLFVLFLGKLIKIVPLSCLEAMLLSSAWSMAALKKSKYILLAPKSDSFVFLTTICITLLIDIVVAVEVGLILSAFLFIKRSVETTATETFFQKIVGNDLVEKECECVKVCGHLFFGAAPVLHNALKALPQTHDVVYIDMQNVPFIDVTGAKVLKEFIADAKCKNINVIISGLNNRILKVLNKMDVNGELKDHILLK